MVRLGDPLVRGSNFTADAGHVSSQHMIRSNSANHGRREVLKPKRCSPQALLVAPKPPSASPSLRPALMRAGKLAWGACTTTTSWAQRPVLSDTDARPTRLPRLAR